MNDSPRSRRPLPHLGWLLLATLATVGLAIWSWNHRERHDFKNVEEAGKAEPAEVSLASADPTGSSTDFDLIELVLVDLMEFKEFRPGYGNRSQIVLNEKTNGSGGFISDDQLSSESRDTDDQHIPAELCADLRERNPTEPLSLSDFKPKNPNILVEDLSDIHRRRDVFAFETKYPDAKGYVKAWLPGYSKDGKAAVVRVLFGPTPHGATATYMLVKNDGRWKVKWKRTAYYV